MAGVILPENLVWWRLDSRGARYAEALAFERYEDTTGFRHYTDTDSNFYDHDGRFIKDRSHPHDFGAVPVVRVFDKLQAPV